MGTCFWAVHPSKPKTAKLKEISSKSLLKFAASASRRLLWFVVVVAGSIQVFGFMVASQK
jgi:hypothetical protein